MRRTRCLLIAVTVTLLIAPTGAAQAAKPPAKPPLLTLRWHKIAGGVTTALATDRYLAYGTAQGVTLIDQQTHRRTQIAESECPAGQTSLGLRLGGPWLAGCPDPQAPQPYTRLYNIPRHYWKTVPGPPCWPCFPTTVGSRWIELTTIPAGCQAHCYAGTLLQNIGTGESKADPVQPRGRVREDLNSATGTSPLCPPLRYPAFYDGSIQQLVPGILTMLGSFALATGPDNNNLLERCHSSWHRRLNGLAIGGARMVIWSNHEWVSTRFPTNHGLLLGSLRQFNFVIPPSFHPGNSLLKTIAVTGRTIYVLTPGGTLWAATVPSSA